MPVKHRVDSQGMGATPAALDDGFLISSVLGGDSTALGRLIDRYDRLVRYTIFRMSRDRCAKDPEWLESLASATWDGFVRSMRRNPDSPPAQVSAYLVRIARNQVATALRTKHPESGAVSLDGQSALELVEARLDEPSELLSKLELLEAIRECAKSLEPSDKALLSQLGPITDRKWSEAAKALGLKESTVRSRWKVTLERLRKCLREKTGPEFLAPGPLEDDN